MERIREEYENKIVMMSQEILRLGSYSEGKVAEVEDLGRRYARLEYELESLRGENAGLITRGGDRDEGWKRLREENGELRRTVQTL